MSSFLYYTEPGIVLDTIAVLTIKCNESKLCLSGFNQSITFQNKMEQFLEQNVSSSLSKLVLFFYKDSINKFSFLWNFYRDTWIRSQEMLTFSEFIARLQEKAVIKKVCRYYLATDEILSLKPDRYRDFITSHASHLEDRMQLELLGFLLNPKDYIVLLNKALSNTYKVMCQVHEEMAEIDHEEIAEKLFKEDLYVWMKNHGISFKEDKVVMTLSYIFESEIFHFYQVPGHYFLVGRKWKVNHEIRLDEIKQSFAVLAEKTRFSVFVFLLEHKEATLDDMMQQMEISRSTLQYHLQIMNTEKVVICHSKKSKGKTKYWRLNAIWFRNLGKCLLMVSREDLLNK